MRMLLVGPIGNPPELSAPASAPTTVRDLLAHVIGLTEEAVGRSVPPGVGRRPPYPPAGAPGFRPN